MDFENFESKEEAGSDVVRMVMALAEEAQITSERIEMQEQSLRALKENMNRIIQHAIPEAMAEAGLGSDTVLETPNGVKVSVGMYVSGALPKGETERAEALEYISDHGGADLIKDTFTIPLPKGEHEIAANLAEQFENLGVAYQRKMDVHAMTLKKFVRENIEGGEDFDPQKVGINVGQIAKVTRK